MTLRVLKGRDFRGFSCFQVECHPELNFFVGPNGGGKTSLLEAIYLMGRGKSFRTMRRHHLWRRGTNGFFLQAQVSDHLRRNIPVTLNGTSSGLRYRIDGEPIQALSQLPSILPAQFIDPRTSPLVSGTPADRRRFMDWGLFHVEPQFYGYWRNYQRAIDQRNIALRNECPDRELSGWEELIVNYGQLLHELRENYLAGLQPFLSYCLSRLKCPEHLDYRYHPGWPREKNLMEALTDSRVRDRVQGLTSIGPHRADLSIRIDGHPAVSQLSRGEEKRITFSFLFAQINHLYQCTGQQPLALIDDPIAELDDLSWKLLAELLMELPAQRFVAVIHPNHIQPKNSGIMFHVEQGMLAINDKI